MDEYEIKLAIALLRAELALLPPGYPGRSLWLRTIAELGDQLVRLREEVQPTLF